MHNQTRNRLIVAHKTYREHSWNSRLKPSRLGLLNTQRATNFVGLLTPHYHSHILDKTIDDFEGLRCGDSSLILRESI